MRTRDEVLKDIEALQSELKLIERNNELDKKLAFFNDKNLTDKIDQLRQKIKEVDLPIEIVVDEDNLKLTILRKYNGETSSLNTEIDIPVHNAQTLNHALTILDNELNYCEIIYQLKDLLSFNEIITIKYDRVLKNHFKFKCNGYDFELSLYDDRSIHTLKGIYSYKVADDFITFDKYGFNLTVEVEDDNDPWHEHANLKVSFDVYREDLPLDKLYVTILEMCEILDNVPD